MLVKVSCPKIIGITSVLHYRFHPLSDQSKLCLCMYNEIQSFTGYWFSVGFSKVCRKPFFNNSVFTKVTKVWLWHIVTKQNTFWCTLNGMIFGPPKNLNVVIIYLPPYTPRFWLAIGLVLFRRPGNLDWAPLTFIVWTARTVHSLKYLLSCSTKGLEQHMVSKWWQNLYVWTKLMTWIFNDKGKKL